jgi:N-methylhydantoinase B
VILDWGTGTLLPESTRQFREVFERRSVAMWAAG